MSDAASTVKQSLEYAKQELQRLERAKQALMRRMQAARAKLQALIDHADKELRRLANEVPTEANQRLVAMTMYRRQGALANLEMVTLLQNQNLGQPFPPTLMTQMEHLHLRSQYCTMEFQMLNYQPILNQLVAALAPKEGAAEEAVAAPPPVKGPPQPGVPRPGTAPLRPGTPPPVAGPPKPPGVGLARPGMARPAGPAALGRPLGAPAAAKPPTGALARPGTAPLGTGPLARPGTGPLAKAGVSLVEELKKCAADPDRKPKLQDLVAKLQDVDFSLQPLRGAEPGELLLSPQETGVVVRQLAGKLYYINRAVAALGPLGELIPFEGVRQDPALAELWSAVGAEAPPEESAEAKPNASLAGRLRSLFG